MQTRKHGSKTKSRFNQKKIRKKEKSASAEKPSEPVVGVASLRSYASFFKDLSLKKEVELCKHTKPLAPMVNRVNTVNLCLPISAGEITKANVHGNHEPNEFAAAKLRKMRHGHSNTALEFGSGKMVVTGSRYASEALRSAHEYRIDCASAYGIVVVFDGEGYHLERRKLLGLELFEDYKTQNLIAKTNLPVRRIDIDALYKSKRPMRKKNDNHPGLNIKYWPTGGTTLMFRKGSCVTMGVKTQEKLQLTINQMQKLAEEFEIREDMHTVFDKKLDEEEERIVERSKKKSSIEKGSSVRRLHKIYIGKSEIKGVRRKKRVPYMKPIGIRISRKRKATSHRSSLKKHKTPLQIENKKKSAALSMLKKAMTLDSEDSKSKESQIEEEEISKLIRDGPDIHEIVEKHL